MNQPRSKNFDHLLHPYIFILKEGKEIQRNFLDYSLLLLQVGQSDILPSPHNPSKASTPIIQLLKR